MPPLEHISTMVKNILAESWAMRGSIILSMEVSTLLSESSCITCQMHIHEYISKILGAENVEENMSCLPVGIRFTPTIPLQVPTSYALEYSMLKNYM